jgi:hypothetical protein
VAAAAAAGTAMVGGMAPSSVVPDSGDGPMAR